jgi:serine/threonine-protein kinase
LPELELELAVVEELELEELEDLPELELELAVVEELELEELEDLPELELEAAVLLLLEAAVLLLLEAAVLLLLEAAVLLLEAAVLLLLLEAVVLLLDAALPLELAVVVVLLELAVVVLLLEPAVPPPLDALVVFAPPLPPAPPVPVAPPMPIVLVEPLVVEPLAFAPPALVPPECVASEPELEQPTNTKAAKKTDSNTSERAPGLGMNQLLTSANRSRQCNAGALARPAESRACRAAAVNLAATVVTIGRAASVAAQETAKMESTLANAAQQHGPIHLDRYLLHQPIASGGMATVYLGSVRGARGFARTVAIKRLHPQFAADPEFSSMLLDEARLAAVIRHPNVVPTLDVAQSDGELFMVMEYVAGESLARLLLEARGRSLPAPRSVGVAIVVDALSGLHAAHRARSEDGVDLEIVHRDVSPQNILVGKDGITRLVDFGIARAAVRAQATREGQLKGKLRYMAPEQLRGKRDVTLRVDVYAAGVVLWEVLTGEKLFDGESEAEVFGNVLEGVVPPPSTRADLPAELDRVVLRALARDPEARFSTALEMAEALQGALQPASRQEVGAWVEELVGDVLARRAEALPPQDGPRDSAAPSPRERPLRPGDSAPPPPPSVSRVRRVPVTSEPTSTRTLTSARISEPPPALREPAKLPEPPETAARPRSSRLFLAAVIASFAALVITVVVMRPASVAKAPTPVSTSTPEDPPQDSAATPTATEVAAPPASAPPRASADPLPPASAASARRPPKAQSRCVPPYYIDSTGIRRVKRDCF